MKKHGQPVKCLEHMVGNKTLQILNIITEDRLPPQVMCIIQTNQILLKQIPF